MFVNFSGTSALGAQRWLSIAGLNIQPSEFAKLTFIFGLSSILDRKRFSNLSKLSDNEYRVKKRSLTNNMNIIFSLKYIIYYFQIIV